MSLQTTLPAYFAAAKASKVATIATVEAQAAAELEKLEKVTGPITGPLSSKVLKDSFEKAAAQQVGESKLGSALVGLATGAIDFDEVVGPVNDPAKYAAIIAQAREEIGGMRAQLDDPGIIEALVGEIPESITQGRSEADVKLIASELRDYCVAVVDAIGGQIEAAAKADNHRARAVGGTRIRLAGEAFRESRTDPAKLLSGFDFASTVELDAKTRSDYPLVAQLFDGASSDKLPGRVLVKSGLGIRFEASKDDAGSLNAAAWEAYETSSDRSVLKTALTISAQCVRLTGATDAMCMDTAACLAAKLGDAALAGQLNKLAASIDAKAATDSTQLLAAIASGEVNPIKGEQEVAARYPALVASCKDASVTAPTEAVYLTGALSIMYEANFGEPHDLNTMAWNVYAKAGSSRAELEAARTLAAAACKISEYSSAMCLDTLACIDHRLGNLESGRQAMQRGGEIDPKAITDSSKLYA